MGSTNPTQTYQDSTSVGTSARYKGSPSPAASITGGGGQVGSQQSVNFPKLVNTIMANPFSHSGLNSELLNARVAPRPEGLAGSRKCKPCINSSSRLKKTTLLTRYK